MSFEQPVCWWLIARGRQLLSQLCNVTSDFPAFGSKGAGYGYPCAKLHALHTCAAAHFIGNIKIVPNGHASRLALRATQTPSA